MSPVADGGPGTDAYARSGVSQAAAGDAVAALVKSLERIDTGKPSRVVPLPGHYASVLRLDEKMGLALSTDTVGTKMVVAERLGRPLGDILLEPTEIYVRPILELLRSEVDVRGLAHITGEGFDNLLRLEADVGYEIDDPLPVPPIFDLIQELGEVSDQEMREVFNMGCGFCCVVAVADEVPALELLRSHYPDAKRIGQA